jgi:hypothetical protein
MNKEDASVYYQITVIIKCMALPIFSMSVTNYVCVPAISLTVRGKASAGLDLTHDAHYNSVTSFDLRGSRVKLPVKYHSSCSAFSLW